MTWISPSIGNIFIIVTHDPLKSQLKMAEIKTSGPIGAWEVKLEIMTDRPTPSNNRDRETDRPGHREVLLPITDSCT